jgi:hypothetical protein
MTALGILLDLLLLAAGSRLKSPDSTADFAAVAVVGLMSLLTLAVTASGWVLVCVWIHRAARNLRGLGRYGMRFSPSGCILWYFVPVASLFMPLNAMTEIWRASDPGARDASWTMGPSTPLLGIWWGAYILGGTAGVMGFATREYAPASAMVGLVGHLFTGTAAVALTLIMRGVSSRQEQAASVLAARPEGSGFPHAPQIF